MSTSPFLFRGRTDGRLVAKSRVVGVQEGTDEAVVVVRNDLGRIGVVRTSLRWQPIIVWW